ncbi:hypothetical protein ACP70R_008753 [Stipagrostis hirtigluma subsp. patula]
MDLGTGAMDNLPSKLCQLVGDERKLPKGVRKQVQYLSRELEIIHATLGKVAEVPADQLDEQVRLWARHARGASEDMEFVIDTYLARMLEGRDHADPERFRCVLLKVGGFCSKAKVNQEIATAIEILMKQLQGLAEQHGTYTVDDIIVRPPPAAAAESCINDGLFVRPSVDVSQLVAIHKQLPVVRDMLLAEDKRDMKIVTIVGSAGLGKTTLAKAAYDDPIVRDSFQCRVFLLVGQNPDLRKVFKDFLICLGKEKYMQSNITMLDIKHLIDEIRTILHYRRNCDAGKILLYSCFVVVDDIWDFRLWDVIKYAFTENDCRAAVLLTSRNVDVAARLGSAYSLAPLSEPDSRILFFGKLFGTEENCPPKLADISEKFIEKTGGVPLAIITAVDLLQSKTMTVEDWHVAYESFCSHLEQLADKHGSCKVDNVITGLVGNIDTNYLRGFYQEKSQLVAIHKQLPVVRDMLLAEDKRDMKIVTIVGSAGLGKTTLAKAAYDDPIVRDSFQCRAFLLVGQNPDLRKVFKDFLICLGKEKYMQSNITMLDIKHLIDEIRTILHYRRCFVVVDDIWDFRLWDVIKYAFTENDCRAAVLLTSRNVDVAARLGSAYSVAPLSEPDSRILFFGKLFGTEENCPPKLADISEKFIEKTGGVPLAIITAVDLLQSKSMTVEDWHVAYESFCSHLEQLADKHGSCKVDNVITGLVGNIDTNYLRGFYQEKSQLVAIHKQLPVVRDMLLAEDKRDMKIVTIVGSAGLGKTTLAKAAYDDPIVRDSFQCRAFLLVGQNPDLRKVFKDFLICLGKEKYMQSNITMLDIKHLIDEIRTILHYRSDCDAGKILLYSCFVVVDDIWDFRLWDVIKYAFTENDCRAAVLLTSRNVDVAARLGSAYSLAPLSEPDSRILFFGKLFGTEENCPPKLADISEKFIEKTGGVPLAILTAVDLLQSKSMTVEDWHVAYESFCSHLEQLADKHGSCKVDNVITGLVGNIDTNYLRGFYQEKSQLVAIHKQLPVVRDMLLAEDKRDMKIVTIVGSAGLGKTTLAKAAYDDPIVRDSFQCRAFLLVGQNPDLRKVFKDFLICLGKEKYMQSNITMLDIKHLIDEIRTILHYRSCFVVIDDVWDSTSWDVIKQAFIENECRSAVLLTSRNVDVATRLGSVYSLSPLSEPDSRILFYNTLFGSEGICSPVLEDISKSIINKCRGVPLAIITTAKSLESKPRTIEDWQAVHDSLGYQLQQGTFSVRSILALSYTDLPRHLQLCFLYLSMFQVGYEISAERLVWGWIAEGFIIEETLGTTLQEVGECYLSELINRNLGPVWQSFCSLILRRIREALPNGAKQENGFSLDSEKITSREALPNRPLVEAVEVDAYGKVLTFRVHDILHGLIISLATEENFATVLDGQQRRSLPNTVRRLCIERNNVQHSLPQECLSLVRSLVVSGETVPSLSDFRSLRILDLGACDSLQDNNLKGIEKSLLLKYLVIGGKYITGLPKEIASLKFLQTLDLSASGLNELPESVFLIRQLERLSVHSHMKIPDGIGKLQALQELGNINISRPDLLIELCALVKLRVLSIAIWSWNEKLESSSKPPLDNLRSLFQVLQNIKCLSILTSCSLDFINDLGAEWAPPSLQKLEIRYSAFDTLPSWIGSLHSISSLSIEVYKLSQEIINMLGKLTSLYSLTLTSKHAPEGKFGIDTDGFKTLTSFQLVSNAMTEIFAQKTDGMQMLERVKLSFQASRTGHVNPDFNFGLEHLCSLKHVRIEIICFNASRQMVQNAEVAIWKAISRGGSRCPNLDLRRIQEKDMIEENVCSNTEQQEQEVANNKMFKQEDQSYSKKAQTEEERSCQKI